MRDKVKKTKPNNAQRKFRIEWKNAEQKMAYAIYQQHDVSFFIGPAGTGKSHLATAFAINDVLSGSKKKIIITRPIVEAGENLGFLPGSFQEKTHPYMMPIYDCIDLLVGKEGEQKEKIISSLEVIPLAYMRGRSLRDAVCILDEAQNASLMQIKLFLSRFEETSKVIITGDPNQSDLRTDQVALTNVVSRLESEAGIGTVKFSSSSIVRHPLVAKILGRLEE